MRIEERQYERILVIGDLHGHYAPLLELMEKINPHDNDLVVFIGDYIDRGRESKLLVQKLIDLKWVNRNTLFLKGNHEDMLLGSLGLPAVVHDIRTWLYNGGTATLVSYGMEGDSINKLVTARDDYERVSLIRDAVPKSHMEFFQSLEMYIETENFFLCHAGLNPYMSIEEGRRSMYDLLWMRDHLSVEHLPWEKTVVCGHTPLQEALITERLICIDTGLHYYGKLTAIELFTKKVYYIRGF